MSRKKAKKSNAVQIGIFTDKKSSDYNQLILETLLSQGLEAWQIAEALLRKKDPNIDREIKEVKRYRTQLIYSVIQRKNGRLEDLRNKGYVEDENGIWQLTAKGIFALQLIKPDLVTTNLQRNKNLILEQFKQKTSTMSGILKEPFGIQIDLSQMREGLGKTLACLFEDPAFFSLFVEEARALTNEGVDLDRIDEQSFFLLVMNRKRLKPFLQRLPRK